MKGRSSEKMRFLDVVITHMSDITDVRSAARVFFPLEEILFLVYCSSACSIESYDEIHDFGEERIDWLRKYLPYENGIPSHDTINRVMSLLKTEELEYMFAKLSNRDIALEDGSLVHIDGKWLGRSATVKQQQTKKSQGGKQAKIMVNVYHGQNKLCMASTEVDDKSGEVDAIDSILALLDLSGCMVTMDAGYCYQDVVEKLREEDIDYLIGLKRNQPTLFDLVQKYMDEDEVQSQSKEENQGHGRQETRVCKVLDVKKLSNRLTPEEASVLSNWKDIASLVCIDSSVINTLKETAHQERRYYISSKTLEAAEASNIVRSHWAIENGLHWVLDVVMGEDSSTKRKDRAAQNFSFFRKLGLNKLQAWSGGNPKQKISVKRKQNKCMMNTKALQDVLGLL